MQNISGEIKVESDKIIWKLQNEIIAEIQFSDILMIGSYTIDLISDDYIIVFVLNNGSWKRISMFAENINELLIALSENFNFEAGQIQLANSTKWNSVISYPKSLRGKKLFKLIGTNIELEKDASQYLKDFNTNSIKGSNNTSI